MRALLLAVVAVGLWGQPAEASHWNVWPYLGFSYGFGPYPYGGPWYGPRIGVGFHVGGPVHSSPAPQPAASTRQGALKLYVYPAAGQSTAKTADDRYECHVWAAGESGHDPTLGAGSREEADGYARAFTACMEARGYVVR